ncbi:MAG: hypothetical protein Q4D62_06625 [Planctomycetia bacterium]|nr:hypothetical protein [Planctomycetia bacterium]
MGKDASSGVMAMKKQGIFVWEMLILFGIFALFGAYTVPDTNEAHYLGKAAFFWNSDYAPGDFFLSSPDAHAVFYWSFGWLTLFCSMDTVAWIGRGITWFLLAVGWMRITRGLKLPPGSGTVSGTLFLFLYSHFSFAGEWVVGGVEAKGFAFAFLFMAIGELVRNHWNRCWLWLGLAAMFHVLIGGWGMVATGFAWLVLRNYEGEKSHVPTLRAQLPGLAGAILLTLPALIPALMLNAGTDAETVRIANNLYVYERLPHHLLLSFIAQRTPDKLIYFGALFLIWSFLVARPRFSHGDINLRAFVYGTLLIAGGGWFINLFIGVAPDVAAALLRYYWFRMADVCLPMGVALVGVEFCCLGTVDRKQDRTLFWRRKLLWLVLLCVGCWQIVESAQRHEKVAPPRSCSGAAKGETWLALAEYVRENTEPDTIFVVPYTTRTFTWYTHRPVVGVWKDIPQDAAGLVEWWNRMQIQFYGVDMNSPMRSYGRLRTFGLLPESRLEKIAKKYGEKCRYIVTPRDDLDWCREAIYENDDFSLYPLRKEKTVIPRNSP